MIVTLSALVLASMQTDGPVPIELRWDGAACSALIDGVALAPDAIAPAIKRWARYGRPLAIVGDPEIPYRCIGATIFALQSGGYRVTGGFGPPPGLSVSMATTVRFTVMPEPCAFRVNDEPVTESELRVLMASWRRYDAPVHLMPDPNAEYRCVDIAMRHIAKADIRTLGFIGNDYVPGPK